ncbi:MAG: sulfatase [Gemmatimonadaceae bacterium]
MTASLTAGLLQLALARVIGLGFSVVRWGWNSRDLIWRVPLGYAVVFLPVVLLLIALGVLMPTRVTLRGVLWTWGSLILFGSLLLFPQINGYASLLLAVALAMRASQFVKQREGAILRVARVLGVMGGVALLVSATTTPVVRSMMERRTVGALPPAPAGAPNVLLIILDTVRADFMSLYGAEGETTPHLERWAQRGSVFDESYSTSSWTMPSHASLFTGQNPSLHRASFATPLAERYVTLAEILQSRGWATSGVTANFMATTIESGLAQGFIHYDDFKYSAEEIVKSTTITHADNVSRALDVLANGGRLRTAISRFLSTDFEPRLTERTHDLKSGEEVRQQFQAWLDEVPEGRPFFAFLNFFDAHAPYRSPEPYHSMYKRSTPTIGHYTGGIRYLDDQVNMLLEDLERRGVLDNTLVIITSDHGEQFGEHGQDAHANSLYRQVIHVPLLVIYPPAVPMGRRFSRPVTGRDIPATVLDVVGVPRDSSIGGVSLAELWRDSTARTSDVVSELEQNTRPVLRFRNALGPMKSLINDTLHVIRDGARVLEAYRYRVDPAERMELVAQRGDSLPFAALLDAAIVRNRLIWTKAFPLAKAVTASDASEH